jgi:hypothetical protein
MFPMQSYPIHNFLFVCVCDYGCTHITLILIRVLTWNLGAAEPFSSARGKAPKLLGNNVTSELFISTLCFDFKKRPPPHSGQFVPSGYDLYVVALQEAVSDEVYDAFEQRLSMSDGISRLDLHTFGAGSGQGAEEGENRRRPDQILGRGDGSMLHPKFTGLAIFARDSFVKAGRIRILKVGTCSTAVLTSKGGAAAALSLDGQSVVFISW